MLVVPRDDLDIRDIWRLKTGELAIHILPWSSKCPASSLRTRRMQRLWVSLPYLCLGDAWKSRRAADALQAATPMESWMGNNMKVNMKNQEMSFRGYRMFLGY